MQLQTGKSYPSQNRRLKGVLFFVINLILTVIFIFLCVRSFDSIRKRFEVLETSSTVKLIVNIKMPPQNRVELYYDGEYPAYTFNEEEVLRVDIGDEEEFRDIEFNFPAYTVNSFRIDPGVKPGDVYIKYIKLKSEYFEHVWNPEDILNEFDPLNQIGSFEVQDGVLHIRAEGVDPFFIIKLDTLQLFDDAIHATKPRNNERWFEIKRLVISILSLLFFLTLHLTGVVSEICNRITIKGVAAFLTLILFMAFIWLPMAGSVFGLGQNSSNDEKRQLAEKPEFKMDGTLFGYTRKFEQYFNDTFGFRNQLIGWNNLIKLKYFQISPVPDQVMIGKDGWLFYTGDNVVQDYARILPFSGQELEKIRQNLELRRDTLKEQGIEFLVFVAPNSHTIYSEYMPDRVKRIGEKTRFDQVLEYLKQHSDIEILDLREELLAAKKSMRLYHKTDTHWNDVGAFTAYREVMKQLSQIFPQCKPMELSDFEVTRETGDGGDLAAMLSMSKQLQEEWIRLKPKKPFTAHPVDNQVQLADPGIKLAAMETGNPDLPNAVMFRDSFTEAMLPFLSEHFNRIQYIWSHNFDFNAIHQEKPDIVIHEMVERYLFVLLN